MRASFLFPIREVQKQNWCSLDFMGVKRLDVVAYHFDQKSDISFAGGHGHRHFVFQKGIHLLFPDGAGKIEVDIEGVKTPEPPRRQKNRHKKN